MQLFLDSGTIQVKQSGHYVLRIELQSLMGYRIGSHMFSK